MTNNEDHDTAGEAATGGAIGWAVWKQMDGWKYRMKVSDTASAAMEVRDTTLKNSKPIFHIDHPHAKVAYDHLNINPKIAGMKRDPHLRLPSGTAEASTKIGRGLKYANSAIEAIGTTLMAIEIGKAVYEDYNEGTHQKKTETAGRLAASAGAGIAGSQIGAAVGTMIFPGIGTIIGGFAGGVAASIGAGQQATRLIDDNYNRIADGAQKYGQQAADVAAVAGAKAVNVATAAGTKAADATLFAGSAIFGFFKRSP